MVELTSVKPPEADPKIGKPRPRSEVSFPYFDLNKSVEVARIIHNSGGGSCDKPQLAALLKYSGVKNGGFLSRISAAKMFGFVEDSGTNIVLSERGKVVIAPVHVQDAEHAKLDAFLEVEFFKQLFDDLSGRDLPQEAGLRNLFANTYKVVPGRVDAAVRVFLDSADMAGLFKVAGNRSKMIRPIISGNGAQSAGSLRGTDGAHSNGTGNEGSSPPPTPPPATGVIPPTVHPALIGLVQNLPPVGEKLGPKRRKALVDAFSSTINFVYPEDEE